jgi:hypothetical protein
MRDEKRGASENVRAALGRTAGGYSTTLSLQRKNASLLETTQQRGTVAVPEGLPATGRIMS